MKKRSVYALGLAGVAGLAFTLPAAAQQPGAGGQEATADARAAAAARCTSQWFEMYTVEGKRMAVAAGGGKGAKVIAWKNNGGSEQDWCLERAAEGGRYLHPRHAPWLCLDVPGSKYANGTKLVVWDCNGRENQRFYLFKASSTSSRFTLEVAKRFKDYCADTHSPANGEPVQLRKCNNTKRQLWNAELKGW
ncbi:RICIN domain-containing protein [Streptomyces monticola]|uniref:RICIN domain-containing protein n=1 Tax=Streptomyces monticola TaxID=2666263 RepID=A0ABW2JBS4_9ACTN